MNTRRKITLFTVIGILLALPLVALAQGMQGNNGQGRGRGNMFNNQQRLQMHNCTSDQIGMGYLCNLPDAVPGDLSDEVIAAMTNGIMDEYNAYNIYQAVINQFGEVRPFTAIQQAEAQHILAWEMLFNRYGVELPEMPAVDESLTFDSLSAACSAAADAEIANFDLYDQMLETLQDYPDMVWVITNLRNASEFHHLPAFERCAG